MSPEEEEDIKAWLLFRYYNDPHFHYLVADVRRTLEGQGRRTIGDYHQALAVIELLTPPPVLGSVGAVLYK